MRFENRKEMDNKRFIDYVASACELDNLECAEMTDLLGVLLGDLLASGQTVSIPSFGNFEPRKRNERLMSNPSSPGRRMLVPPKLVASFKPSPILKNKINE